MLVIPTSLASGRTTYNCIHCRQSSWRWREKRDMLQYRLEGSGQPLLLIHGWGVTYTIWQDLAPLLTPHFELIMIELPGVGGSPQPDPGVPYYPACAEAIEELREALAIDQWTILAYSTGTRVAETYI